jgi:hypothetical protein
MSLLIYRLAKKRRRAAGKENGFVQTITTAGRTVLETWVNLVMVLAWIARFLRLAHRERRNSSKASFSAGFSFSNFSVT